MAVWWHYEWVWKMLLVYRAWMGLEKVEQPVAIVDGCPGPWVLEVVWCSGLVVHLVPIHSSLYKYIILWVQMHASFSRNTFVFRYKYVCLQVQIHYTFSTNTFCLPDTTLLLAALMHSDARTDAESSQDALRCILPKDDHCLPLLRRKMRRLMVTWKGGVWWENKIGEDQ